VAGAEREPKQRADALYADAFARQQRLRSLKEHSEQAQQREEHMQQAQRAECLRQRRRLFRPKDKRTHLEREEDAVRRRREVEEKKRAEQEVREERELRLCTFKPSLLKKLEKGSDSRCTTPATTQFAGSESNPPSARRGNLLRHGDTSLHSSMCLDPPVVKLQQLAERQSVAVETLSALAAEDAAVQEKLRNTHAELYDSILREETQRVILDLQGVHAGAEVDAASATQQELVHKVRALVAAGSEPEIAQKCIVDELVSQSQQAVHRRVSEAFLPLRFEAEGNLYMRRLVLVHELEALEVQAMAACSGVLSDEAKASGFVFGYAEEARQGLKNTCLPQVSAGAPLSGDQVEPPKVSGERVAPRTADQTSDSLTPSILSSNIPWVNSESSGGAVGSGSAARVGSNEAFAPLCSSIEASDEDNCDADDGSHTVDMVNTSIESSGLIAQQAAAHLDSPEEQQEATASPLHNISAAELLSPASLHGTNCFIALGDTSNIGLECTMPSPMGGKVEDSLLNSRSSVGLEPASMSVEPTQLIQAGPAAQQAAIALATGGGSPAGGDGPAATFQQQPMVALVANEVTESLPAAVFVSGSQHNQLLTTAAAPKQPGAIIIPTYAPSSDTSQSPRARAVAVSIPTSVPPASHALNAPVTADAELAGNEGAASASIAPRASSTSLGAVAAAAFGAPEAAFAASVPMGGARSPMSPMPYVHSVVAKTSLGDVARQQVAPVTTVVRQAAPTPVSPRVVVRSPMAPAMTQRAGITTVTAVAPSTFVGPQRVQLAMHQGAVTTSTAPTVLQTMPQISKPPAILSTIGQRTVPWSAQRPVAGGAPRSMSRPQSPRLAML